jgi:hypothetical protein
MSDNELTEPIESTIQEDPIKKTNRWIFTALNVLSLLIWISVFTSWLFHFPARGETGKLIILACVISGLSTLYWKEKGGSNE